MKNFRFCLLLLFVFVVIGCGGSKNTDQVCTDNDPADTTNDNIATDSDETTDNNTATDEDTAEDPYNETDKETSDDELPTDDDNINDSDGTTDDNTEADEDTIADFDSTVDEDIPSDDDTSADSDETTDNDDPMCDLENGVTFVKKPEKMSVVQKDRSVFLVCEAEAQGCEITYQWYESKNNSTDSGIARPDATNTTFETPVFTEKGIRYYYCAVTAVNPAGESRTFLSNIASVAYTALPTLYINTPGGVGITSKEEWVKNAEISVVGAADESWNFENVETSIRGRGNSTWNRPKKPYSLKLKTAREIMGMPEHKRWVLIANYYDGSFMRNETAFYFSRLFEMDWTVRGEFVDLVLNGRYNGLYWLGEAIKVGKNRVDIKDGTPEMTDSEDKDYLIEMDLFFDETLKFKSEISELPYMIQNEDYMVDENDEITAGGQARLERLTAKINALEMLLYPDFTEGTEINNCSAPDESYAEIIDIDSWVKLWLVNEIMDNRELEIPRSAFFTFDSTNNIFKAGPVWDFDQAATQRPSSCQLNKTVYYNALFKSPKFVKRTKELWNDYSGLIDINPPVEAIRSKITLAAKYDAMRWTGAHDFINTALNNDRVKVFEEYVDFLKESIRQKITVVDSYIENLSAPETNP